MRFFSLQFLFLSSIFFLSQYLSAQENTFNERIDFVGEPYTLNELSFNISEIQNQLPDSNQIGKVYFGDSKELYSVLLDPELEKQFKKFFKQALKETSSGDVSTVVVFKTLAVDANTEDTTTLSDLRSSHEVDRRVRSLGTKNWKNRNYKISIDYLIKNKLALSDSMEVDSFAHMSEYDIDQFCSVFFKESLKKLDEKVNQLKLDSNSFLNKEEEPNIVEQIDTSTVEAMEQVEIIGAEGIENQQEGKSNDIQNERLSPEDASYVNLGIGGGQPYGGVGVKTLIGYNNTGLIIGIGSMAGTTAYSIGAQLAIGEVYLNLNYGAIGVEEINGRSPDLIIASSLMLGAMINMGPEKNFFFDLAFGHTFGAEETVLPFETIDNNRPVFAVGINYRFR